MFLSMSGKSRSSCAGLATRKDALCRAFHHHADDGSNEKGYIDLEDDRQHECYPSRGGLVCDDELV